MPVSVRGVDHQRKVDAFWQYVDEISLFIMLVISILVSDFIDRYKSGHLPRHPTLLTAFSWINVMISVLSAFSLYGGFHARFSRWKSEKKPHWIVRFSMVMAYGVENHTFSTWLRN